MNEEASDSFDSALQDESARYLTSTSHGTEHLDRVMHFARQLWSVHGGDLKVITAAVRLHDLGRAYPNLENKDSAQRSAELARPILLKRGMVPEKIDLTCAVIAQHDQPNVRPTSTEGRILKDADFLAGSGAQGVLRSALWTGEKRQDQAKFFERVEDKMRNRIAGLEFPESRLLAEQEYRFVRLFLEQLGRNAEIPWMSPNGRLIVLEGISGTGKDTQAQRLKIHYEMQGQTVASVSEPSPWMASMRSVWKEQLESCGNSELFGQLLLYTLDRHCQITPLVSTALESGHIVISVRNYLSSMVYQSSSDVGPAFIAFLNAFAPTPDLLILLDAPADIAWSRVKDRTVKSGQRLGDFEKLAMLEVHRQRYLDLAKIYFPRRHVIDAAQSVSAVEQAVLEAVSSLGQ